MTKQDKLIEAADISKIRQPSRKVAAAINLYIREGRTKKEAAKTVGISASHLSNALLKPHVKEYESAAKALFIQDVEAMRAPYKAEAFEHARYLMKNAKSEAVQGRMVEFLAGESKASAPSTAVQVNINSGSGYEYVRPGQSVVEIKAESASLDTASSEEDTKEP